MTERVIDGQPTPPARASAGFGTAEDGVWRLDPTQLAVEASRWRGDALPDAFCGELGRRLLLAELEFSEWVLRRVDKADLEQDRKVSKQSTIEFAVRDDAPVFIDAHDRRLRLVPLSVMRRQTLVNLSLRDESDEPVTIPGIRLTQMLDESILLAAAATCPSADYDTMADHPAVRTFIREAISGPIEVVRAAYDQFDHATSCPRANWLPDTLVDDPLFRAVANRLRHNFTLYVLLDEKAGHHRLVHVSFDEPTVWAYRTPTVAEEPAHSDVWTYTLSKPRRVTVRQTLAGLGWLPTRFRFLVPGAENAASYHFELKVPLGVQIVRAVLIAGRPNGHDERTSVDHIVGHSPVVGLHAVEVPNGSLCRVQVDLRAPFRGWLSTMLIATGAIAVVMSVLAWHWGRRTGNVSNDLVTNLVLILITASAAVATLLAQRDSGEVGARFVVGVRYLGTLAISLPVGAASTLVYDGVSSGGVDGVSYSPKVTHLLVGEAIAATVVFLLIFIAWACSVWSDRSDVVVESPWDMTTHEIAKRTNATAGFHAAVRKHGFHKSGIIVRSAEGWHTTYAWTDEHQGAAIDALRRSRRSTVAQDPVNCALWRTACAEKHACTTMRRRDDERPWARRGSGPHHDVQTDAVEHLSTAGAPAEP